jgi:sensor domain CHASE-containing protein
LTKALIPFVLPVILISVVGISLTAIVQVKSEAHDKELYQKFKQDIDNEVADMRDLLRQHINYHIWFNPATKSALCKRFITRHFTKHA